MIYPSHNPDTLFHINGFHTAFDTQWDSAFDFHGESHDFWEIVTILSGKVEIVEDGKVYVLGPGQMICHRPNEFHRIKSAGGTNPNVCIISLVHQGELPDSLGRGIFDLSSEMAEEYATIFSWIFPFVNKRASGLETTWEENIKARMGISRLEAFLLALSQMEGSDRLLSDRVSASEYHDLVRTLHKSIHNNLTLKDLSDIHHISESYIKKLFKTYAGGGAMTYYNRLRIREIKTLIHEGKSADDIAKIMNFSSVSYLSYYFKRETGTNIREYRSLIDSLNE